MPIPYFMYRSAFFIATLCYLLACTEKPKPQETTEDPIQIAFLSDVHLTDVYGQFEDTDYKGVRNPGTERYTLARTMQSQLESTRLFNENYFAFLAALDRIVDRGIRFVVMPGDFSDDGQRVNVKGLQRILTYYSEKYGIRFITTTGNHDPARPFFQHAGKSDFLGEGGKSQPIFSKAGMYEPKGEDTLPVVVTEDIAKLGYDEILQYLQDFGFFPKPTDTYWETPFSDYGYSDYEYDKALEQSHLEHRKYAIPPTFDTIPDVSYLVEPSDNLWFLAIDGNVYVPKDGADRATEDPAKYSGASTGYSEVLTHKSHLLPWMKSVAQRAKALGKTLIVFSHFPVIDFNDDASPEMKRLFGEGKMQLHRVPSEAVAQAFADAGIKVHFGGHMHSNDTGIRNFGKEKGLVNVQIPSLAAYIPAFKVLTLRGANTFEVETVVLDTVPGFKDLFPLYEQEHAYLSKNAKNDLWNKEVLAADTYKQFTLWHLRELVRLRFLRDDWPEAFKARMLESTGIALLQTGLRTPHNPIALEEFLTAKEMDRTAFESWTGLDMIHDFYKLKNADELALSDIGKDRLQAYKVVCEQLEKGNDETLRLWATIFLKMCSGVPSDHFIIDLESGAVQALAR